MLKTIILIAATVSAPALAADPSQPRTATVSSADLNLAGKAGIAALDRRIRNAVERVCGVDGSRELKAIGEMNRCREQALARVEGARAILFASAGGGTPDGTH